MKSLTPFILIVLALGFGYLYLKPQYEKIQDLRLQKITYAEAFENAKQISTLRDTLTAKYDSISSDDKALLQKIVPKTLNTGTLVSDLSSIASNRSLALKSAVFKDKDTKSSRTDVVNAPPPSLYKTTVITFVVTGNYSNFVAFLKDLELNVQLVDVTGIAIEEGADSKNKQILQFTVTAETYSLQ